MVKDKYELNIVSQLIDLYGCIDDAASKMNIKPFEVFFTLKFVMDKLSLNRYHAKKLIDSMVVNNLVHKTGNRYRVMVENALFGALCNMAEGY